MLFLFSSNFVFLLSFWSRQTWVNVQFALNKNCALEVYGVFAVYHLGFSSNQFQSFNKSLINQACSGPYWENIGPSSFLYGPRCAWSVLSRPRADILPVRSSRLVNTIYGATAQAKQPRQKQTNRLIIYRSKGQEVSGKYINMNSFININSWLTIPSVCALEWWLRGGTVCHVDRSDLHKRSLCWRFSLEAPPLSGLFSWSFSAELAAFLFSWILRHKINQSANNCILHFTHKVYKACRNNNVAFFLDSQISATLKYFNAVHWKKKTRRSLLHCTNKKQICFCTNV